MMLEELASANGADANSSDTDGANANATEMCRFAESCLRPLSVACPWVFRGGPSSVITLSVSSWSEGSAVISEDGARGDGDQ